MVFNGSAVFLLHKSNYTMKTKKCYVKDRFEVYTHSDSHTGEKKYSRMINIRINIT